MTKRERNILYIALAVGVVFILTQGFPAVNAMYTERAANLEEIRLEIERERRLRDNAEEWQQRREEIDTRTAELEEQVFEGDAVPLISADMQRMVREYAMRSGLGVTSTRLAESLAADEWLLVEQEVSFQTNDQRNLLSFLRELENSSPALGVSAFSVRRNRNQYIGNITVVGFSRTVQEVAEAGE